MAHFAKLDQNNVVETVLVIANDDCGGGVFPDSEPVGQEFIKNMGLDGVWLQTSYNNNFRKNYASVGGSYDPSRDAFIPEKFFNSWILNEDTCLWEPPIPMPENSRPWLWDEDNVSWRTYHGQ